MSASPQTADHTIPSRRKLVIFLGVFLACLMLVALVIIFHVPETKIALLALLIPCGLFIVAVVIFDAFRERRARRLGSTPDKTTPNKRNTLFIIVITTLGLPCIYWTIWYPRLNQRTIHLREDIVNNTSFPSVAVFQKLDWSSQADIATSPRPKCFLGWFDESAPRCDEIMPGTTCNCNKTWASEFVEPFNWRDVTYRMLLLSSTQDMLCVKPTTIMLTQVFFTYNATKAREDAGRALAPSLWVAAFDPSLTIYEALELDLTRMQLVSANGMSSINLDLHLREVDGRSPAYDYELSISSTPSLDLNCDTTNGIDNIDGYCWMSLFLQFPTFDRRVFRRGWELDWEVEIDLAVKDRGLWDSKIEYVVELGEFTVFMASSSEDGL